MTVRRGRDRALLDAIDQERIEADLRALVRVPSVTGDEGAVAAVAAERLRDAGADEVVVRSIEAGPIRDDPSFPGAEMPREILPIVLGRVGRPDAPRLLLVGHLDVVPIGDGAAWSVDPWAAEVRGGRLYGRGACDMKGGVAAILGAVRALVRSRTPLEVELIVALVPSEEDGGAGMLAAIRDGLRGEAAIITEPTRLEIIVAHAGAITFRLEVPGRAAHAAMRREGVSALDGLAVLLRALDADETARNAAEQDPLMAALALPYPTIVGTVSGGAWASTVLDRVVVEGRYGVRLGQSPAGAEAELRGCVAAAAAADPWLRDHPPTIEVTGGRFGSARVDPREPLPRSLQAAATVATGRTPALVGAPYGSDMRLLIDEAATPTVLFGPGDVAVAHSADEYVALGEVLDCAGALARWAADAGGSARVTTPPG